MLRSALDLETMSDQQPWMVGVQAGNATAEDRERVALVMRGPITDQAQGILLSTCHRVELYGFGSAPRLRGDVRVETGAGAVQHLVRVAAGLESAIVGEDEVLHQVRQALAMARASGSVDSRLGRLFETAISAGRRARADRTVASGNLAQRAVAWLQQKTTIAGRAVLIVGAGRMGSALAHAAKVAGSEVTVASRSATRARRLARVYRGRGVDLAAGAELALGSAGVAVALAGVWHQFQPLETALPPIADISAPPAVPQSVRARLNGGFLGIDDLYARAQALPDDYIENAEQIVDIKTREFVAWLEARK